MVRRHRILELSGRAEISYHEFSVRSKEPCGGHHRLDGPAIIETDGSEYWCRNDLLHRLDGPAIIWGNGSEEYWVNENYISSDFGSFLKYLEEHELV